MSLFTLFERAINEHGSATILKERLLLIKEQHELLKKKNHELENQATALRNEIQELRSKINSPTEKYKMKWGCIEFSSDENLYCPACYIERGRKMPTSRKSPHLRYCTACKTEIPSS